MVNIATISIWKYQLSFIRGFILNSRLQMIYDQGMKPSFWSFKLRLCQQGQDEGKREEQKIVWQDDNHMDVPVRGKTITGALADSNVLDIVWLKPIERCWRRSFDNNVSIVTCWTIAAMMHQRERRLLWMFLLIATYQARQGLSLQSNAGQRSFDNNVLSNMLGDSSNNALTRVRQLVLLLYNRITHGKITI